MVSKFISQTIASVIYLIFTKLSLIKFYCSTAVDLGLKNDLIWFDVHLATDDYCHILDKFKFNVLAIEINLFIK